MGKLGDMINQNEIELNQFFTMHPFSASEKMVYDLALEEIDFFKELYVKTNKTYEHLAVICNVINNAKKNLVVITGYRGCGKTNFLRLIKNISDGKTELETLEELLKSELNYSKEIEDLKEAIQKNYKKSKERIESIFFNNMYNQSKGIYGQDFVDYISYQIKGKCKYINFDEGGMGRQKPFSTKLFYNIRRSVVKYRQNGRLTEILRSISGFSERNQWIIEENFDNIDFPTLKSFWKRAKEILSNLSKDNLPEEFLEEMKKLSLEQLLFVYTIWEYAEIITSGRDEKERKLIYLLDNIDIISDGITDIFKNTMMGIWKFIWDTRNVFMSISEAKRDGDKPFVKMYSRTKIIVAMRETTAMHISGHLRDRMRGIMGHFDISSDVDKAIVMQKRIDLAMNMINAGEITSNN